MAKNETVEPEATTGTRTVNSHKQYSKLGELDIVTNTRSGKVTIAPCFSSKVIDNLGTVPGAIPGQAEMMATSLHEYWDKLLKADETLQGIADNTSDPMAGARDRMLAAANEGHEAAAKLAAMIKAADETANKLQAMRDAIDQAESEVLPLFKSPEDANADKNWAKALTEYTNSSEMLQYAVSFIFGGKDKVPFDIAGSMPKRPQRAGGPKTSSGTSDARTAFLEAVRTWAREHGRTVADRGRIAADVINAYVTATGEVEVK